MVATTRLLQALKALRKGFSSPASSLAASQRLLEVALDLERCLHSSIPGSRSVADGVEVSRRVPPLCLQMPACAADAVLPPNFHSLLFVVLCCQHVYSPSLCCCPRQLAALSERLVALNDALCSGSSSPSPAVLLQIDAACSTMVACIQIVVRLDDNNQAVMHVGRAYRLILEAGQQALAARLADARRRRSTWKMADYTELITHAG